METTAAGATETHIDMHAVYRAKMVERLAVPAQLIAIRPADLTDQDVRENLLSWIGENPKRDLSATTWVLLAIRLGGNV